MQSPSTPSNDIGGDLPDDARRLKDTASERIRTEVETRKAPVVDQVRSVSSALDNAAQQLSDGGQTPSWIHSLFEQGALQMRRLADAVEHRDSRQLLNELRTVARNNPATYLAGCAAAGFAASRILRAEPNANGMTASLGGPLVAPPRTEPENEQPFVGSRGEHL
jgi:hypothetical protein